MTGDQIASIVIGILFGIPCTIFVVMLSLTMISNIKDTWKDL